MKLTEYNAEDEFIKAILKGLPGTRKTTQAATFPGPIKWIDTDKKLKETLSLPRKLRAIPHDTEIDYEQPENWYNVERILKELVVRCDYRTVVLDSITSIGDRVNRQTLMEKSGQDKGKKIGGISVNSIEDYNAETSALMYMVDLAKQIKAHTIIIGHVIQRENTSNNQVVVTRQLVTGGKVVGAKLPAYIPEIYHFDFEQEMSVADPPSYVMYTQMRGIDFARTGLPLPFKVDLTRRRLYDILREAQERLRETTPEQLQANPF
jgi:AAA domain